MRKIQIPLGIGEKLLEAVEKASALLKWSRNRYIRQSIREKLERKNDN